MTRQQCMHGPAMVWDPRCHGRRLLLCMGQTRMRHAKVIDRADQDHPRVQRQGMACQRPAATRQRGTVFPNRGVEPLHRRGVDHASPWCPTPERLHTRWRAIDHAAFDLDDSSSLVALDDLGDPDLAPRTPPGPSARACVHRIAKEGSGQIRAKIYAKALRILPQRDGSKIRRVFHNELPSQLPSASALLRSAPGLLLGYTLSTNPL
jgi:hypothetical protein